MNFELYELLELLRKQTNKALESLQTNILQVLINITK